MTTMLSSKGQVVLPKQARLRLRLRPGVKLVCEVQGDSLVLTPEHPAAELPRLIQDPKSGPARLIVRVNSMKRAAVNGVASD